jgi:hypothetical protein
LPQVDVAQLLRHDLEAAAWDLEKLTADEAYNYSRYARDAFEPARLQEIDAAFDRFSWVNETENAKQLVPDLFEIAARTLPIGDLFSFGASVETRETWLRDAVASLPDYAARRDDMDDWLPILRHQGDDSVKWPSNRNKVLFDLLAKRGLRRVGHQSLKLRNVAGAIKYGSSSPQYEHHAGFAETDWVWLIETTGAPQIFFADPAKPRLEDAQRREIADRAAYNESAFARQQDELVQKRAANLEKRRLEQDTWDREKPREQKKARNAPSSGVMARIRGWLDN